MFQSQVDLCDMMWREVIFMVNQVMCGIFRYGDFFFILYVPEALGMTDAHEECSYVQDDDDNDDDSEFVYGFPLNDYSDRV